MMGNPDYLEILRKGVNVWNSWREDNPEVRPNLMNAILERRNLQGVKLHNVNLSGANLTEADLSDANLSNSNLSNSKLIMAKIIGANLFKAELIEADLLSADLSRANLTGVNLTGADLFKANLTGANLSSANLFKADLSLADLSEANLTGARLTGTHLVETHLKNADLTNCSVYGISAWNLKLENTKQTNLVITPQGEPVITVDDLEVAQFIYLLLNRKKLRNVLDIITSKAVLLLGRFSADRKTVLDALADKLRKHNLLPIIFDFERSTNRDFTETIKILAGLSLFVIVDITKPKSAPQELTAIIPDYQIPFVPILEEGENQYSMFADFKKYDWVLKPILIYRTKEVLLENFRNLILEPAWKKHLELQRKKNEEFGAISIEDVIGQKEESVLSQCAGQKE